MKTNFARTGILAAVAILTATGELRATETGKAVSLVTVIFVSPEKFTDVKDNYTREDNNRDNYLARLKAHLEKRAVARLAAGQKLTVTFTDIDLAGDFEPWRGIYSDDIRIMREIYSPRMKLTFALTDAGGKVVKEGARELTDPTYLWNKPGFPDDDLRYDKELLDDWLRQEFPRART
jgi:hypothetical protein